MKQEMPAKLDKKDKKILAALELDSRQPLSSIGRKAGLSKATVAARIARMERQGFIDRFTLALNYEALGIVNYRFYVKFEGTPSDFEQQVAEYLFTRGSLRWICFMQGEWDLVFRFLALDLAGIRKFESDFMDRFGKYVKAKAFAINYFNTTHNCTFLTGNEGAYYFQAKKYSGGVLPLSQKDYRVLFWLCENSRMPTSEIARREGMSPDAVAYRIRRLEKRKAFFAYIVRINRLRAGYLNTKVIINTHRVDPKRWAEFLSYCDAHPYLSFYGEILGSWDMELDMDARDTGHLYLQLREIRTKFPDIIRDVSVLQKIREFEPNPFAALAGKKIEKKDVPPFSF